MAFTPAIQMELLTFCETWREAPGSDETIEMTFAKDNAAEEGCNRWTINGAAYPMSGEPAPPTFHLKQGKRYRLRMRNASDDIHPIHLHRHKFELTSLAGKPTAGVLKDVVMLGGYQGAEVDFVADNPGLTLFPLPPTVTHGLRLHDSLRLRLSEKIVDGHK
jgi:FtsP/CotA-like multicopper oxidase with cupredoxin domain